MGLPFNMSESTRRMNAHLFQGVSAARDAKKKSGANAACADALMGVLGLKQESMIRQHAGDGMNKTERAFLAVLKCKYRENLIYREVSLPLANGVRYKLDFLCVEPMAGAWILNGFEVKGRPLPAGIAKLKIAASMYPWISFTLAWRKSRTSPFQMQDVLP